MKKLGLLAASVALALTGCGGSNDSNGNALNNASTNVKVLDGYLVNAEVYVDRNGNNVADANEKLEKLTDENGVISIKNEDTKYSLIVRAIAGKTYDTDKGGRLTQTTEMMATAGSDVVTPFTTLAAVKEITIDELAAELNLPKELIAGDYVAGKTVQDTKQDAQKVHAVARSVTSELGSSIEASKKESDQLLKQSGDIVKAVDEAINNSQQLDDIVITFDDAGKAVINDMPPTVKEYFVGSDKTFYSISTNEVYFRREGLSKLTFAANEVTVTDDNGKPETFPIEFTTNGFKTSDGIDEAIYMSDAFSLVVTPDDDMIFYTQTNIDNGYTAITATDAAYRGKTFYHMWDDSTTDNADPDFVTIAFAKEGDAVTITEGTKTWKQTWKIENEALVISGNDMMDDDSDWVLHPTTISDKDFTVHYEGKSNENIPYFFTDNKALAQGIYDKWQSLAQ